MGAVFCVSRVLVLVCPPAPGAYRHFRVGKTFAKVFTKVAGCGRKAESRAKVAVGARGA